MGYSLSNYGAYDKGKKLITKEFAGILFSSSFTVNGGLKESACLALRVPNWPWRRPAENTGEARGKSTALLTHDQQACKGNSKVIESMSVCQNELRQNSGNKEMWP